MSERMFKRLLREQAGTMAIETVLVAPVLALMALGVFQVGMLVSRQQELQSGASEAESIVLAAANGPGTDSTTIQNIVANSLHLKPSQVTLQQRYRCDNATTLVSDAASCPTGTSETYRYILLTLTDTYTPLWAQYGVGSPFQYNVSRTIQVG